MRLFKKQAVAAMSKLSGSLTNPVVPEYDQYDSLDLALASNLTDGLGHVITSNGCTFDDLALRVPGSGAYISTPIDKRLQFGTGDLTMEFWFRKNANYYTWPNYTFFSTIGASGTTYRLYASGGNLMLDVGGANVTFVSYGTIQDNWGHLAWTRHLGTYYLFVNGTQVKYASKNGTMAIDPVGTLCIGGQANGAYPSANGWISNVRIAKGIARYTGNFIPSARNV